MNPSPLRKTYFALADAKLTLQQRKSAAGSLLDLDVKGNLRVLESTTSTGRRCKGNFGDMYNGDARVYERIYDANGQIARAKAKAAASTPLGDLVHPRSLRILACPQTSLRSSDPCNMRGVAAGEENGGDLRPSNLRDAVPRFDPGPLPIPTPP
ncbi:hypothetical protein FB451DRAFT_1164776 [Mycena latifolia]|nr:hypothetical protein FB451DRAFT_1164776 [Mycena latifolia]